MKLKLAAALAGALFLAASPVWAGTVVFDFTTCSEITSPPGFSTTCQNMSLGSNTATYTSSGLTLTASGWKGTTPNDLYVKFKGGSENGLGLTGTPHFEIQAGEFIYFNMMDLLSHGYSSGTLQLGSVQSGDVGNVCEASSVGAAGVDCHTVVEAGSTGGGTTPISWSATDPYIFLTSNSGDELAGQTLTASSVPEPSTLLLFGTALLAGAFTFRKFYSSEASC